MEYENCLWDYLRETEKPIIMYGMGDGAVKIMKVLDAIGVRPAEFMASDEFVRGHSFLGYQVKKLSEIEAEYDDFIILVCFGSALPEVTDRLYKLAEKHELYAPDVPVIGEGLFDGEFVRENRDRLEAVREMLSDERSRLVFDCWINFRLSGKISYLKECESKKDEAYSLLMLKSGESYVDLGAYNGDTAEEFISLCGDYRAVWALEPDARSYSKLCARLVGYENIHALNAASWSCDAALTFYRRGGRNSSVNDGRGKAVEIPARSVDSVLAGKAATLIKMDVEGCEKETLEGAAKTLAQFAPKLIVSLYHRNEDIFVLPELIQKLGGEYRMYLRHHPYIPAWDMNLYCIKA